MLFELKSKNTDLICICSTTDDATAGTCTDTFAVTSGSSRIYPNLCGTLTGQHSKLLSSYLGCILSLLSLEFQINSMSHIITWDGHER